jgi:hypothetical protein
VCSDGCVYYSNRWWGRGFQISNVDDLRWLDSWFDKIWR